MIDEVAWMVEISDDNFVPADPIYWPDGSYLEGNFVFLRLKTLQMEIGFYLWAHSMMERKSFNLLNLLVN